MGEEFFWRVFLSKTSSFEELEIIGDICLMMTTMVNLHSEGIDMRLESTIRIG
jgi:hypothetical protein